MFKFNRKNQGGATLIEYALVVAVIALVIMIGGTVVGDKVGNVFDEAASGLEENTPSSS